MRTQRGSSAAPQTGAPLATTGRAGAFGHAWVLHSAWRSNCFPWTLKWNIKPQVNLKCKEHFLRQTLRECQLKATALLGIPPPTYHCGAGRNGFLIGTPRSSGRSSIRWLRLWSAGLRVHHSMNSEDKIWNSVFSNRGTYWKYGLG